MTQVTAGELIWRITETGVGGRPILFLHGFSGNGGFWFPVAKALDPRHCILPDLPGHGGTTPPLPPDAWSLDRAAGALADAIDRIGVDRYDLVGYSMGGRIALHLALRDGARIGHVALVGTSCGLESPAERAQRVASDEDLASQLEREGIEAFVERWEALPLLASQKELPEVVRGAMHTARIRQEPLALAAALRAFSLGNQWPLGGALSRLSMPVLLVAGGKDSKYCRIAEQMGERIAGARVAIVADAGHAVPLERPEEFSVLLAAFLGPLAAEEESRS